MSENRSKTVVIIALCLTLIFMGVGFAALSQSLTISTEGTLVTKDAWEVQFEDFTVSPAGVGNSIDATGTTLSAKFQLAKPGDSVTYTGVIANNGTIDAKLQEITAGSTFEHDFVERTISFPEVGSTLTAGTNNTPVTITYTFKDVETLPETAEDAVVSDTITFYYVQK